MRSLHYYMPLHPIGRIETCLPFRNNIRCPPCSRRSVHIAQGSRKHAIQSTCFIRGLLSLGVLQEVKHVTGELPGVLQKREMADLRLQ